MSEFEIRRLGTADVPAYQALFLEALRSAPSAFAADYEQESVRSLEEVGERLQREATYGAFVEGRLGGIATFQQQMSPKRRHLEYARSGRASRDGFERGDLSARSG
jgi:hypothetical protein